MRTVDQALLEAIEKYPNQTHTYMDSAGNETTYTKAEIAAKSEIIAAALQERGLKKGDRIGLVLIEPEEFILTFIAALRAGIVPVPLYPPMSMADLDAYIEKLTKICDNASAQLLIVSERIQNILWQVVSKVPSLKTLLRVDELLESRASASFPELAEDDMAFLQYTSGSTSDPKGVIVTHGSLWANASAVTLDGLKCNPESDITVSWLPLYHDMGLIGFVLSPLLVHMSSVFIPTIRFLKRPSTWMDTISRHRGTISFCPPFALALAARRAKPAELERWDLSCLRAVGVGAEPIQPEGARLFTETFSSHCGMPEDAVTAAYGMAEATLAMALTPEGQQMRSHFIDGPHFQETGRVRLVDAADEGALEHVSCGETFPEHGITVFTLDGEQAEDGVEGQIHFRGPSVAKGYFRNEEATREAFRADGWLATGDLGYMWEGEVYVTGRLKDLIIINGRNIHPQAIEWPLYELEGVRPGNVVAFSRPGKGTEELIIAIETTGNPPENLEDQVRDAVTKEFGVPVTEVVLLDAGQLPKTSSGKLQRRRTRQLFMTNKLHDQRSRAMGSEGSKLTIARHVARSVVARVRNIATR